jgi:cell wall-associated NlpC family hydrolase
MALTIDEQRELLDLMRQVARYPRESRSPLRHLGEHEVDTIAGMAWFTDGNVHVLLIERLAVDYADPQAIRLLCEVANADPAKFPDRLGDAELAKRILARVDPDKVAAALKDVVVVTGKLTPADDLPLKAPNGATPTPTLRTRNNNSSDEAAHLDDNPMPSALLAGVVAQEWRRRLAKFEPGDPLPDPRTPTGDKAIDVVAHAAGQQNTSYAWGGNLCTNGPSHGNLYGDTGGGAHAHHDDCRIGYDCGGLVRYAIAQGAVFDTRQGTDAIDTNENFQHVLGGVSANSAALASTAQPGDVLIFGGGGPPFAGNQTVHTGIYIGNGYMVNAPQSGDPVEVDSVGRQQNGTATDILRVR